VSEDVNLLFWSTQGEILHLEEKVAGLEEELGACREEMVVLRPAPRLLDAAIARAEAAEDQLRGVDEEAKEAGDNMNRAAATVRTQSERLTSGTDTLPWC